MASRSKDYHEYLIESLKDAELAVAYLYECAKNENPEIFKSAFDSVSKAYEIKNKINE